MTIPRDIFATRAPADLVPMGDLLRHQAGRDATRPALTFANRSWRRDELAAAAARRATRLAHLGIAANENVVVMLPAGLEFHITCFGIWMLGATPVPLSAKLAPHELAELVALSGCRFAITAGGEAMSGCTAAGVSWQDDLSLTPATRPSPVADHWKAITSGGSTGRPKLIVDARPAVFDPLVTSLAIEVDDVLICPAPVHHNAPFSITNWGLAWGAHVIETERFDPVEVMRLVETHRARWLYLVPTMMARIWALPPEERSRFDLSSLEAVVHMAAPCPAWLKRHWIEWLGPDRILEIYAGTESIGACTITGTEWLAHPGSVGRPLRAGSVRILDDDGRPAAAGEIGAIWFRRPEGSAAFRYVGAAATGMDGWETYGDMGSLDPDGYLYLADRRTDMFVSGGVNIWPAEVEAALEQIEGIRSAVVVGLPDDDLGQVGHAIVEPAPDAADPVAASVRALLATRLTTSKMPRTIEIVRTPLRDEAGKVRRSALRTARIARLRSGETFTEIS